MNFSDGNFEITDLQTSTNEMSQHSLDEEPTSRAVKSKDIFKICIGNNIFYLNKKRFFFIKRFLSCK